MSSRSSVFPARLRTTIRSSGSPSCSITVGGVIQFCGLNPPVSAWTRNEPSALSIRSRTGLRAARRSAGPSRRPRNGRRSGASRQRTVLGGHGFADRRASAALDARTADDRLATVGEPHERLTVAVVVRRPDDELRLGTGHAHRLTERGRRATPVGDERIALPLTSDRRLVGVSRAAPASPAGSIIRPSMTDRCTTSAGPPPTASLNRTSPLKHTSSLTTNATPSSE